MAVDMADVKKRLEPTHLTEEVDQAQELRKQIEEKSEKLDPESVAAKSEDPKNQIEYTFDFKYTDARGKVWSGKFTNRILNERQRRSVGIMRSMLTGGQPYESLDVMTRDSALIHSHLQHSLVQKPKWAEKLDEIYDFRVLQALFEEVDSHEATFLGLGQHQSPSEEGG